MIKNIKKKKPLVSIALATYNGSRYLRAQIDSVLNQTYQNIELIISDDCSTDNTRSILKSYEKSHPFIHLNFNKKNLGYLKNFEKAISLCKGDFVALCDQDDIWVPNKIDRLVEKIGNHDIIASDLSVIDSSDKIISPSLIDYQGFIIPSTAEQFRFLVFRNSFTGCTMLIRQDLISESLPIPKEAIVHDWWFAIHAARRNGIKFIKEPLVKYRQHQDNAIGAKKKHTKGTFAAYLVNIFSKKRRDFMRDRFDSYSKRVKSYIDYHVYNQEDYVFLQEVYSFYSGYHLWGTKWKTLYYGFKLRKYIYGKKNILLIIPNLLAKIV
jgi:glycosyltransferase involved in cell wall biosynthesis